MPARNSGGKGRGAPKASVKRGSAIKALNNTKYAIAKMAQRKHQKKKTTGAKKTPRVAGLAEFSSNASDADEQGESSSSSSDEDKSTPTGKEIDVEEVKREALDMDLSIARADELAKWLDAPKDLWKEVSSWAKLASNGDPEYASRLRYSYLSAILKVERATAAVQKLPRTEKEAKELMKFIKNDSHARVCTTSLDGMKMFTHVRGILQDLKAHGLEYLIAAAYMRREIETEKTPLQEFAGIGVQEAFEFAVQRRTKSPKLYDWDHRIAAARILATFGDKDSCPHMLDRFNEVRYDPVKCMDLMLQVGSNAFQPDDPTIDNLLRNAIREVCQMFQVKPKWSVSAMFEALKVTFKALEGIPPQYWEDELMCHVSQTIKDAPAACTDRRDHAKVFTFCQKIASDYSHLNIGKPGYGRTRGVNGNIYKAPCDSASFLRALASIVNDEASMQAHRETFGLSNTAQAKVLTHGAGTKRKFDSQGAKKGDGSGGAGGGGGFKHKPKKCYACGRPNHIRAECRAKKHVDGGPLRGYNEGGVDGRRKDFPNLSNARKVFEQHARANAIDGYQLDHAISSFDTAVGDVFNRNAELEEKLARLETKSSKGKGGLRGGGAGKGKKNKQAKAAKKKARQAKTAGAQQLHVATEVYNSVSPAADGGSAGQRDSGLSRNFMQVATRSFGFVPIALCFFGMFMCAEAASVGTGTGILRQEYFRAGAVSRHKWQGRVYIDTTMFARNRVQKEVRAMPVANNEYNGGLHKLISWSSGVTTRLMAVREGAETFASTHLSWVTNPYVRARGRAFSAIKGGLEALVRFSRKSSDTGCVSSDDPRACDGEIVRARTQFERMCARVAATTFGKASVQRYVRASSVTGGVSRIGTFAADLHDSIELEGVFPWWDMRRDAGCVELTDAFSRDRVKACRRRRKSKREATESDSGGFVTLLWVGAMAVFAAAVFNYVPRATFVDLLTMRELVEGAAALAACVSSTALPAIVRVLGEIAFLLVASVMWAATSIFVIVPLKAIALVLKFGVYLIDLWLGTLPTAAQRRRARSTFRRLRACWAAAEEATPRRAKVEREVDIAQRLLNNRTLVERFLGEEKAATLPTMDSVFQNWFGNISALFSLDADNAKSAEAPKEGAHAPGQNAGQTQGADDIDPMVKAMHEAIIEDTPFFVKCLSDYKREYGDSREHRGVLRNLLSADGRDYLFDAVAELPRYAVRGASCAIQSVDLLANGFDELRAAAMRATQPVKQTLAKVSILVDSGANISAITLRGLLWKMRKLDGRVQTAQKGNPITVLHAGTLRTEHFDIDDVRYIPELSSFILAVADVTDMGWSAHFFKNHAYLERESDRKRIYLTRRHRCWYLEATVKVENERTYNSELATVRTLASNVFEFFSNCFCQNSHNMCNVDGESSGSGNSHNHQGAHSSGEAGAHSGGAPGANSGGATSSQSSSDDERVQDSHRQRRKRRKRASTQGARSGGTADNGAAGARDGATRNDQQGAQSSSDSDDAQETRRQKRKRRQRARAAGRAPTPPSAKTLHNRFHVQHDLLKRFAGKAYYGQDSKGHRVKMPDDWASHAGQPFGCDVCYRAKSRIKRGKPSHTVYDQPGAMVAVDTFSIGKTGAQSLSGARYASIFVDLATRYIKIYVHKERKDRLLMFQHYIAWAASYKVTIRAFRVDPAREWLVAPLRKYFDAKGIRLEVIPPRQQDANGVAERCVQLVKQTARALMLDASAPHSLWALAVQYAVEINNVLPRVPARKVNDRLVFSRDHSEQYASAHELYFNSLPDISQFKRFGTMAYAHVDRQELLQRKQHAWLSSRADRGVYVGVFEGARSQLVLLPDRHNLLVHTTSCRNDETAMYYSAGSPAASSPAAATTRGNHVDQRGRTFVPAELQQTSPPEHEEDDIELEDCLSGTEEDGNTLEQWQFNESYDRRPLTTEELKRKLEDAEEVGMSSDDDDLEDDVDAPGAKGSRNARKSQRARKATTFFKPGRHAKINRVHALNTCPCKKCRVAALQGGLPQPRVIKYSFNKVFNDKKLWDVWREPCEKEWAQFHEAGRTRWGKPNLAKGDKVIPSFWRLLEYYNDAGHLLKRKSRVCIQGNKISAEDNDFDFSFSSTVSYDQVRLMAALCATSNKELFTADVRGAFLSVPREQREGFRKLWMRPPSKQYEHPEDPSLCLEVKAAFYGLRDSARLWWLKFREALVNIGFVSVDEDPCFYVRDYLSTQRKAPPDINSKTFAAAALWVDDLLVLSSKEQFATIVEELKGKGIDIDKQSPVQKYVGLDFHITHLRHNKQDVRPVLLSDNINSLHDYGDRKRMTVPRVELSVMELADKQRTVTLSQTAYIVDTFHASGVEAKPCVKTPAPVGWVIDKRDMPKVPDPERVKYFRSIYGRVLHIARCTRPDCMWVCSEIGRVASSPSEAHVNVLKRVVQYLYNTRGLGLRYGGKEFRKGRDLRNRVRVQVQHDYEPIAYADASFADEPQDRRSMSGHIIFLNGAAIAYRSKRQSFAVSSTCESEIMALSSVVREIQSITRMLTDLGFRDPNGPPVVVYEDNQCALSHCYDDTSHGRTKALDLREAVARQAVQRGIMNVVSVRSKDQLADIMCKQADKGSFEAMRNAVLGMSMADVDESLRGGEASGRASCSSGTCTCSENLDGARKRAAARQEARAREAGQRASSGAGGAAASGAGSGRAKERRKARGGAVFRVSFKASGGRRSVHWSG